MAFRLKNKNIDSILQTQQGKTYTVFGITLMTVVLLFVFAIRPAWVSITNKLSENKAKTEYIDDAEKKLSDLTTLSTQYTNNEPAIRYLNEYYLPEIPTESFVVENFTRLATKNSLNVQFLNVEKPEAFEDESTFGVNAADIIASSKFFISFEGSLENTQIFITSIEDMGKIIDIQNLSLVKIESDDPNRWQVSIQGNFYFWDIQDFKLQ